MVRLPQEERASTFDLEALKCVHKTEDMPLVTCGRRAANLRRLRGQDRAVWM